MDQPNTFPQQDQSIKIHGTNEDAGKEKYLRDSGKIEDMPDQDEVAKMSSDSKPDPRDAEQLADRNGAQATEENIDFKKETL